MSLQFPWPEAPASGSTLELKPGLHWLRMPLPLALDHINLYLLEDGDGWFVVDTGMNGDGGREVWEALFPTVMQNRPIKGVIVTHMHPDHVGLAGWLCERFKAPLYMSFGEYFSTRCYTQPPPSVSWTTETYFRRAGMDEAFMGGLKRRVRGFGSLVSEMPGAYRRLRDGDELMIGGRTWRIVVGSGHSPEHVCLHCTQEGWLLSGDQVIADISSNVGVLATEPDANPLAEWLQSHRKLMQLPADTLVFPAHNKPFLGLHERLQQLIDHHEERLQVVETLCAEPRTAAELMPLMFHRPVPDSQFTMALGECLAHLHLLMQRGRIERRLDTDGLYRYRALAPVTSRSVAALPDAPLSV